ncbi:MAG: aliphatic sulfonate ABC transporter substrate-binding protein [Solibacillus sp.]
MKTINKFWLLAVLAIITAVLAACGNDKAEDVATDAGATETTEATEVRIGYFPNMTHIATIVALEKGYYAEQLGDTVTVTTRTFSDGSGFMEGMSTDAIDLGTVGPTPALNNYIKNPQHEIIAGAVNGGAVLVVRADSGIETVADLAGKTVAIPTFGSTQDIGLMKALQDAGLKVKTSGGDVNTVKQAPADTAALFIQGQIDAAATQEPWGVNIETNAGAKLLLGPDEFAWGNESTNTVLVATKDFTSANPETTKAVLKAHTAAIDFINANPAEAIQLFLDHVKEITGKELSKEEVEKAFERLTPTTAVNEEVLKEMATISKGAGYINSDDIAGLVNLSYLEEATK